jgi:hypothetical protein
MFDTQSVTLLFQSGTEAAPDAAGESSVQSQIDSISEVMRFAHVYHRFGPVLLDPLGTLLSGCVVFDPGPPS